jgi:hypothetical protein
MFCPALRKIDNLAPDMLQAATYAAIASPAEREAGMNVCTTSAPPHAAQRKREI